MTRTGQSMYSKMMLFVLLIKISFLYFHFDKCREKTFINENKIIVLMCHLSHSSSEV